MDKDLKGELVSQDLNGKFVTGLSISHLCYSMKVLLQYFYLQVTVTEHFLPRNESPSSVLL